QIELGDYTNHKALCVHDGKATVHARQELLGEVATNRSGRGGGYAFIHHITCFHSSLSSFSRASIASKRSLLVIIPTSFPLSTTGRDPNRCRRRRCAASRSEVCGVIITTWYVIISSTV